MSTANASRRFALLREVFDLAREQRSALNTGALVRYQQMLGRRARLLDELTGLTANDGEALPDNVILFPRTADSDADDRLALDTLIQGILEHDRNNELVLAGMLQRVGEELRALENGRRHAARYALVTPQWGSIDRVS